VAKVFLKCSLDNLIKGFAHRFNLGVIVAFLFMVTAKVLPANIQSHSWDGDASQCSSYYSEGCTDTYSTPTSYY